MAALDPKTQAIIDAINASTDRLAKGVVGSLGRIFGALSGKNEEPFLYSLKGGSSGGDGFLNLAATVGNVVTGTIHIDQDADFVASRMHSISVVTSTGVIMPPQTATGPSFSAMLRNLGSDRQLMQVDGHNECVFGTGQRSVPFTKNWVVRRNADIQVRLTNLQAVATQVWILIWGYKIFDRQALDLTGARTA